LKSFTSDGVVIASNSPSSPPAPEEGPTATRTYTTEGHGAWVGAGSQVRLKFLSVEFDEQSVVHDIVQVTAALIVAADNSTFTGAFQIQVSDPAGNILLASPGDAGTVLGTRISV